MFKFKNGTLKKNAYVAIDGVEYEVHMPEYEGETPLSAENLNRVTEDVETELKSVSSKIDIAISDVTSKKATMHITADTAKGAVVTLPFKYFCGGDTLDVYLNGERLILSSDEAGTNGHYTEVGEVKSISNQIKITTDWNLEAGDYLEFVVKGEWGE